MTTDIPENDFLARTITHKLYDANEETRISQEVVLGIGGVKVLEALKFLLPFEDNVMRDIERIYSEQGFIVAYEEVVYQMELLAQKSFIIPCDMAVRCNLANQNEKALDWIEKGFEIHDPNMPYITTGFAKFDQLYDNPRFIAILEKMNLPLKEN